MERRQIESDLQHDLRVWKKDRDGNREKKEERKRRLFEKYGQKLGMKEKPFYTYIEKELGLSYSPKKPYAPGMRPSKPSQKPPPEKV